MTEVDNLAYSLGLPETWKARLEEAARVELGVEEQSAIARTKVVYLVLITATLIGGVANCRRGDPSGFMLPFVAFLLGRHHRRMLVRQATEGNGNRRGEGFRLFDRRVHHFLELRKLSGREEQLNFDSLKRSC